MDGFDHNSPVTKNSSDDGFDLLYLQDDEYYFSDHSVSFSLPDQSPVAATLKLCSNSIYLVNTDDRNANIIRIPLDSVESIEQ